MIFFKIQHSRDQASMQWLSALGHLDKFDRCTIISSQHGKGKSKVNLHDLGTKMCG